MDQGYKLPEIDGMNVYYYLDVLIEKSKPKPKPVRYMDDP